MALVMLPCELPWWPSLQRHLKHLLLASSTQKLVDGMLKIHDMCNISLDPEEDERDPHMMDDFYDFIENDMTAEERTHFMDQTLPSIVKRCLNLKQWKPSNGFVFSLQQQPDCTELSYNFVSSLLAHAFFSTYPKRTLKTHPTLQDFNFSKFFKHLKNPHQKAKLKSIFHYFDWIESNNNEGSIKFSRQIMNSKQWLTIEDWQECNLPLCQIQIKHDGKTEGSNVDGVQICFANSRLGGEVLGGGCSQESITMCCVPDILAIMLSVEAMEDNEIIRIEGARRFSKILDIKQKCRLELLPTPKQISVCCLDPESYAILPTNQYEEDNVLRELNKCLLAFQQKPLKPPEAIHLRNPDKRLSPIGESFSHTPPEVEATVIIKQTSASTVNSSISRSPSPDAYCAATINLNDPIVNITRKKCHLTPEMNTLNNRRGRFIVLGSSGECLPVKRTVKESCDSLYSSCNSSFDEFHSANTSFDEGSGDEFHQTREYSLELNTLERRESFARRLKDALRREMEDSLTDSFSTDSSYAVGISISGSGVHDKDIKLNRGGSHGFVLTEDSLDEDLLNNSLKREQEWISKFRSRRSPGLVRRDTNDSSKYSFSTEYSSELEEVYEQFSNWLDDPIFQNDSIKKKDRELDSRDLAVVQFASSLLKRTLSESFAGVSLTDGSMPADRKAVSKHKLMSSVRSLSLELARHKHKLAAQLKSKIQEIDRLGDISENNIDKPLNGHDDVVKVRKLVKAKSVDITNNSDISPRHKRRSRKTNKLKLVIGCITEAIEQTVECENYTMKIQKSQLSQLANKSLKGSCIKSIITGNWGCGASKRGNPQMKFIIQWLASSVAGTPSLIYYTHKNPQLFKLDTLFRILIDRKWTVGHLISATLRYTQQMLYEPQAIHESNMLFDELIGIEKFDDD